MEPEKLPKDPRGKDYPATRPKRQNGQQDHHGAAHTPDEFDVMNPARPENLKDE